MIQSDNKYRNLRVEFHILQAFPVTCLNRDDVGAPKTAIVGGVTRARVSSQCWKRYVRLAMQEFGIKLAYRTKNVVKLLSKTALNAGIVNDNADACFNKIVEYLSKDTLLFITDSEAIKLVEYAKSIDFNPDNVKDKTVWKLMKDVGNKALDGLDIALFGRMVAQAKDSALDINAAASFSHAISTHKVTNEVEFFTALDDLADERGSAHMGSLEFNSSTYYRYVSLDLGQLFETLQNEEAIPQAVEAFTKALYVAVPAARQTTQSGASTWDYAKILVRKGQRLQLAFETPVKARDGGYLKPSIDNLNETLAHKEKLSGSLFGKLAEFTFGVDPNFSIDELVKSIVTKIRA